uniref:Uncharacterized protein n=1 Tax=Octopus bimaculoides TaxID=37653 RepID=A0A0L8I445_OCTBM
MKYWFMLLFMNTCKRLYIKSLSQTHTHTELSVHLSGEKKGRGSGTGIFFIIILSWCD